jgi:uncharacterized protein (TIGR02996 family)
MTSDPQEQAFLADIRDHPEDDTPRRIFADWLEERGKPGDADRAEFICAQLALASGREATANDVALTKERRTELQARADALLKAHRQAWMPPLRAIMPGLRDEDVTFARGFPSGVTLRSVESLEHAARLASIAPLQEVHLDLGINYIGPEGAQALAESPHLQNVMHLNLCGNPISDHLRNAIERRIASRRTSQGRAP